MLAASTAPEWVQLTVALITGAGLVGGVAGALLRRREINARAEKLSAEEEGVIVGSAKDLVAIQREILADIRNDMDGMQKRLEDRIEEQTFQIESLRTQLLSAQAEGKRLRQERDQLTRRVTELEAEVASLRASGR